MSDRGAFEIAGATHAGAVRPSNEDRFAIDAAIGLAIVADGMGGERGGELAAETAVQAIQRLARAATPAAPILEGAFAHAADRVREVARRHGVEGMGATAAAIRALGSRVELAHVGDVRIYLLRARGAASPPSAAPIACPPVTLPSGATLTCVTRDHSSIVELVERGHVARDAAARHPLRGRISRALGRDDTRADVAMLDVAPGDRFVVCSDGAWSLAGDDAIAAIVEREPPERACSAIVEAALSAGGSDNITVAVLQWR